MSSDSIDSMIESFVGSVRQNTEVKNKEQGALSGFSLKEKEYSKDEQGAAQLLREKALLGWKKAFPTSRKEPHWSYWGQFVREHLGISKIGRTRLEKIFQMAGLGFSAEEKMIILKQEEIITPEETPILTEAVEILEEEESSEEDVPPAPANPLKSIGPETLECGHINWYTEEANAKAREEGYCCAGRKHKGFIDWTVRGLTHPVPDLLQRGNARFQNAPSYSWTGYCCCPHTGLYIGGIANDCRSNLNGQRCVVHKGTAPRTSQSEDYKSEYKEKNNHV